MRRRVDATAGALGGRRRSEPDAARIAGHEQRLLPGLAIISYVIGDEASGHCAAGPAITDKHRGLLQDRLGEVLRDRVVAVVCDGSGYRGGIAASFPKRAGTAR